MYARRATTTSNVRTGAGRLLSPRAVVKTVLCSLSLPARRDGVGERPAPPHQWGLNVRSRSHVLASGGVLAAGVGVFSWGVALDGGGAIPYFRVGF